MRYMNARSGQRFLSYFIDSLIMGTVEAVILALIPLYNESLTNYARAYEQYLEATLQGIIDTQAYSDMMMSMFIVTGLGLLVNLPIYALYLVVLPYYWNGQTVGRLAMGLRVVNLDNEEKVGLKNLILREIVGSYLVYNLGSVTIVIPILVWYYSATRGRTIADFIGGTRLIYTRAQIIEDEFSNNENRDFVDAKFKEVNTEEKMQSEDNSQSDDSEYKVF